MLRKKRGRRGGAEKQLTESEFDQETLFLSFWGRFLNQLHTVNWHCIQNILGRPQQRSWCSDATAGWINSAACLLHPQPRGKSGSCTMLKSLKRCIEHIHVTTLTLLVCFSYIGEGLWCQQTNNQKSAQFFFFFLCLLNRLNVKFSCLFSCVGVLQKFSLLKYFHTTLFELGY